MWIEEAAAQPIAPTVGAAKVTSSQPDNSSLFRARFSALAVDERPQATTAPTATRAIDEANRAVLVARRKVLFMVEARGERERRANQSRRLLEITS